MCKWMCSPLLTHHKCNEIMSCYWVCTVEMDCPFFSAIGLSQIPKYLPQISQRNTYTFWTSCLLCVNSDLIPCAGKTQSESSYLATTLSPVWYRSMVFIDQSLPPFHHMFTDAIHRLCPLPETPVRVTHVGCMISVPGLCSLTSSHVCLMLLSCQQASTTGSSSSGSSRNSKWSLILSSRLK